MTATAPKTKKSSPRKTTRKKKKKTVKKSTATILIISIAALIALLTLGVILYLSPSFSHEPAEPETIDTPITDYSATFHDIHSLQKPAAEACGITPITDADTAAYIASGRLKRIYPNKLYYLHDVSYPCLVPAAVDALDTIATRFQQRPGMKDKRLRLTSCMRTADFIKKLRRGNGNAVNGSCHLNGTTFDISYALMDSTSKQALGLTLRALRDSGYIYVIHEVNQPCFHITIRPPSKK